MSEALMSEGTSRMPVTRVAAPQMPTQYGWFTAAGYSDGAGGEHVALVLGNVAGKTDVLVRVHSKCCTGDVFASRRCDCGTQRDLAMAAIAKQGQGVFIYLDQEGRGIGLLNKLRAYELQQKGLDTFEANEALGFPADMRDYGVAAKILADLNVASIRLMTNNPDKLQAMIDHGIVVGDRLPLIAPPDPFTELYLQAKAKSGHHLTGVAP